MQTYSTRNRLRKPTRSAFALGVLEGTRIVRSWQEGDVLCELVQDDQWYEREDGSLLYTLHYAAPGRMGTEDFMAAADAYSRALTVARELEFEAWLAEEKAKEAKPQPRRPYTFEPSATDRQWWAENDAEASLGRLAPVGGGIARAGDGRHRVLLPPRHPRRPRAARPGRPGAGGAGVRGPADGRGLWAPGVRTEARARDGLHL